MLSRFFLPLTVFSLLCSHSLFSEEEKANQEAPASTLPKRMKPHYAGARRHEPKQKTAEGEKKAPSRIKNKWFSSKTQPKTAKKEETEPEVEEVKQLPEDRPYFKRADHRYSPPAKVKDTSSPDRIGQLEKKVDILMEEKENQEGEEFPRLGFQAPQGHVYFTGEWLYWRACQEGMEYATAKKVEFDFSSGFRAGFGVHLPHDGWDIYVNYTHFSTKHSDMAHGPIFPSFLYGATTFVGSAHAGWKIALQAADLEIGRVFYIGKTLCLRPFFGAKGAWIDQNAHMHYEGGFIPHGQIWRTHLKNDFKGGGPLLGIQTYWDLGVGLSFFGNAAAAIVIGAFENHQKQHQSNGFVPIDLNTDLRLASSVLQLVTGLGWDRNFCRNACHFGISAGFEAQYWAAQNQVEQFTTAAQPYYVRENGDLALYGLTLRTRIDF